jgi:hypothetical protein
MAELVADLPSRVIDSEGREFYVSVVGNPRVDGEWEGGSNMCRSTSLKFS